MLTVEQAFSCVRVCQMLSNLYQAIHLFRYDSKLNTVFILATNQNDEEAWSAFLEKLGDLDDNQGYSPDLPTEEMEQIFQSKLNQKIPH